MIFYKLIFLGIAVLSFILGFLIYRCPQKTFEFQKKFYASINWRIEPISFEKEIRNTKFMGLFLMGFVIVAGIYYFLN